MGAFGSSEAFFWLGAALELAVPIWAERHGHTPWHRHHITERYGLFTIIVLGESVLASTNAVIHAAREVEHLPSLVLIAATALVIVAAMWWIYFSAPQHGLIKDLRSSMLWGYGHFLIFLSAAAIAPGIEVALQYRHPRGLARGDPRGADLHGAGGALRVHGVAALPSPQPGRCGQHHHAARRRC